MVGGKSDESQQEDRPSSSKAAATPHKSRATATPRTSTVPLTPGTAAKSSISKKSRLDYALVMNDKYAESQPKIVACVLETKITFHNNSLAQVCFMLILPSLI